MTKDPNKLIKENIAKNAKVVLAFSSGPDSVFLLDKLLKNKCKIILAHFNHKLRGKDSEMDQDFAKKTAKKHNLEFETQNCNIKKFAKENSLNIEEAARIKRYEFLRTVKQNYCADLIVTAHHANDNLETFLLNFLRGAGLNGLKSMQVLNNDIFRPLLYISKQEILQSLKKNNFKFRIDKSNNNTSLKRNNIRKNIIPKLQQIQPELIQIFNKNTQNINELDEIITDLTKKYVKSSIKFAELKGLSDALIKQIIVKLYQNTYYSTENLTSNLINRCLKLIKDKKTGKKVQFGKNYHLVSTSNSIELLCKDSKKTIKRRKLNIPGITKFEFGKIEIKVTKTIPKKGIFIDFSKVKSPLYIRGRKNGDRFRPFGLKGTKKIQDYFTDKKIPQHMRKTIPLITNKNNEIVVVGNYTIEDKYKISKFNKDLNKEYLEIILKTYKL